MPKRAILLPLLLLFAAWPAFAADLSKIDRGIRKEPTYASKTPLYCLLTFGAQAETRVWLVLDGMGTLYVDCNANGDLTDPGETLKPASQEGGSYCQFPRAVIHGMGKECSVELIYFVRDDDNGKKTLEPRLDILYGGRRYGAWGDETGEFFFTSSREDAPVLNVGGPLVMGFEVQKPIRMEGPDKYELSVGVGVKGYGKGSFTHLCYNVVPETAKPDAIIEFPHKDAGKPPIRIEFTIKERC